MSLALVNGVCPVPILSGISLIYQPTCMPNIEYSSVNYHGWYTNQETGRIDYGTCYIPPKDWNKQECVPEKEYNADNKYYGWFKDPETGLEDFGTCSPPQNDQDKIECVPDTMIATGSHKNGDRQFPESLVSGMFSSRRKRWKPSKAWILWERKKTRWGGPRYSYRRKTLFGYFTNNFFDFL